MEFPAELSVPPAEDRYQPIPEGTNVTVKLARRLEDGEKMPLGDLRKGINKNGKPFVILPLQVAEGEYSGRFISMYVNWTTDERSIAYLTKLYEAITGSSLDGGGQVNLESMTEALKTGLFEVEVGIQRNDPQYNEIKRFIRRTGEAEHPETEDVSIEATLPDDVDEGDVPF